MTAARYLAGVVLAVLTLAPLIAGALRLRRRLVPEWSGAPARLAEVVLVVAALLAVCQVLGTVGAFSTAPVVAVCVVVGTAMAVVAGGDAGHGPSGAQGGMEVPKVMKAPAVLAALGSAVAVAQWTNHVFFALHNGMLGDDTLNYHLPFAARFVQQGSITPLHFTAPGLGTQFAPANAELLHSVGMLWFGRDILSPFLNMAWLGITLLAAWCAGRRHGVGPAVVLGVVVVLTTPVMVRSQPGSGMNDILDAFFLLTAVAFLVHAEGKTAPIALAGVAAGLGVANKPSLIVPVLALTVGVVYLAPVGRRVATARTWAIAILVAGGFWYLRNLVLVGNPLPGVDFRLGPLALPSPRIDLLTRYGYTTAHYLFDLSVWRHSFRPGLRVALGPGWALTLALVGAGVLISVRGRRIDRVLAVVAVVAAIGYAVTPASAFGLAGRPLFFAQNLRWLSPAIIIGLLLLAWGARRAGPAWELVVVGLLAAGVLFNQLAAGVWPAWLPEHRRAAVAVGLIVVLAIGFALGLRRVDPTGRRTGLALAVAVPVVAVLAWPIPRAYLRERYADSSYPLGAAYTWARSITDARVAIGGFYQQYPLYGVDLSNRVQYVGHRGPYGSFSEVSGCAEWRRLLNAGGYRYVVTGAVQGDRVEPPQTAWTRSDPAAVEILRKSPVTVFRLTGRLNQGACASLPNRVTPPPRR